MSWINPRQAATVSMRATYSQLIPPGKGSFTHWQTARLRPPSGGAGYFLAPKSSSPMKRAAPCFVQIDTA